MRGFSRALAAACLTAIVATPVHAQVWEGLTAGVVADRLLGEVNNTINNAVAQGDYLMARAGVQAKDAIDAWKVANTDLLDKAFNSLQATQRDTFLKAHALLTKTDASLKERMETAQQITESAANIIESLPIVGKDRTFATRYGPRIIPGGEEVILTVRGVNFDDANPHLMFDDKPAKRTSLTQNEVQFQAPKEFGQNTSNKLIRASLKFSYSVPAAAWYSRLIGGKNVVEREFSLIVLPEKFATYSYASKSKVLERESKEFTADLGQFKGRNTRIYKIANPPSGYKWDLSKPYTKNQGHGEAGRCEGFDTNASTENGISLFARVDEIKDGSSLWGISRKDGYVSCTVSGTVYRIVEKEIENPPLTGELEWGTAVPIKKPAGTISQTLTVKLFNGATEIAVGDGRGQFFETTDAKDILLLSPLPPPLDTK
jgi:IPT/TIG domain